MRYSLIVAAIALIAAPALGGPELSPLKGTHNATYSVATGELTPTPGPVRHGWPCWSSTYDTGWYFGSYAYDWVVLDWGDIEGPEGIDGFQFAYGTDMLLPDRLDCIMWFYGEENGINSYAHVPLAGFRITDLPTGGPTWNGWIVTVDLEGSGYEFTLDGSDLDADGLVDFGYTYWFQELPTGSYTGPLISGDPNGFDLAPGQEDVYDTYTTSDPNQGTADVYVGSWWYLGDPFAQFWMELYGGNCCPSRCPEPGASGQYCTADIWPHIADGVWMYFEGDCQVELVDLATLLSNYGMTSGAAHEMGDVEPENGDGWWIDEYDGDGDIDLADLAEMLNQYGNDCNRYGPSLEVQPVDVSPTP